MAEAEKQAAISVQKAADAVDATSKGLTAPEPPARTKPKKFEKAKALIKRRVRNTHRCMLEVY